MFVADYAKMSGGNEEQAFYSATDTGFISQNVYLYCALRDLATVVVGYFDRGALKRVLNLKPSEHVILTQPVAWPE